MNKQLLFFIFGLVLSNQVFGQEEHEYWVLEQRTPNWALRAFEKINASDQYKISDFVNPFYFEEDFNGDKNRDVALLIINKQTNQKGILIMHGRSNFIQVIGAGTKFGNGSDDYFWMDVWKIFRGSQAHELIISKDGDIEGSKSIAIINPSIEVIKTEASSGLIYWDGIKYTWAQVSD